MPEGVPMTDQQPHPQRCETCVKYSVHTYSVHTNTRIRFCDGIVITGCGEDACVFEWVKTHGCASHSSAIEPVPENCPHWHCGTCNKSFGLIEEEARKDGRERVLSCVQEDVNDLTKEVAHGLYTNQGIFEELQKLSRRIDNPRQQEGKP